MNKKIKALIVSSFMPMMFVSNIYSGKKNIFYIYKNPSNRLPKNIKDFGELEKIGKGMQGTVFKSRKFGSIIIKRVIAKPEVEIASKFISSKNEYKTCEFLMKVYKIYPGKNGKNYIVCNFISGPPLYLNYGSD